jgi:hypothetical protein
MISFFSLIFLNMLGFLWLRIVWLVSIVRSLLMDRFLFSHYTFFILLCFCYSARFDAIYAFVFEIVRRGVGRLLQCGVPPILWPEKM